MKHRAIGRGRLATSLVLATLAWSGCATSYQMKVDTSGVNADALVQATAKSGGEDLRSYKIKSKVVQASQEDLRNQEAAELLKNALNARGYYESPSLETADMIVELDYGMEHPRTHLEETQVPVYAQTTGNLVYSPVQVKSPTGAVTTRTVPTMQPPNTQLLGYETVMVPVTTYEKYFRITARENHSSVEGKGPSDLWTVSVSSDDESNDLRKYLPLLASTSIGYIGAEVAVQRTVKLKESNPTLGLMRQWF